MSVITIQCRLVAEEDTLRTLWELMANKYTPFINELLVQLGQHPEFETWLKKGEVPKETIERINKSLSTQEPFAGQPGRFYTSAITLVKEIYKSWFTLQQRRLRQIEGKERWLKIFKSDIELQQESQCDLNIIRTKASEILNSCAEQLTQDKNQQSKKKGKNTKKNKNESSASTLMNLLFNLYETSDDCLYRCAIAYLIKNNCQVSYLEEEPEQYIKRRHRKEIEIERLRDKLKSRIPNGRDLTGKDWLSTLNKVNNEIPKDENEFKLWQKNLLKVHNSMPFTVDYRTNTDLDCLLGFLNKETNIQKIILCQMYCLKLALKEGLYSFIKYLFADVNSILDKSNELLELLQHSNNKHLIWQLYLMKLSLKSGLDTFIKYMYAKILNLIYKQCKYLVQFNGLKEELNSPEFYICCDKRQLHYFKRFYQDWQNWHHNEEKYSSGLFLLRSARLFWQERTGKGKPWQIHHLILQCSIDTRLLTKEGTEIVRLEKINQADKTISNMEKKGELSKNQLSRLKRELTTRQKLNHSFPDLPSKPLYQGKPNILVGVSLGLGKPVTLAVVDAANQKVLTYRNVKQLLGKKYNLLNRQQQQQQYFSHKRHKAQKDNAPNSFGESELGQYVDRLLANAIVAIAKTYSAGSIVLPKLRDMREIIQSEVQARAEEKIPGYKKGQQEYAKQYLISVHRWSYGRLIETIESQATQAGILIEISSQPSRGNLLDKARDLALFAYQERQLAIV
ncbi:hypothetical protein NIES2111_28380 [Nostoc sp. NIES-2111]|nr:hypothetical protein NIES2111_28380 [Nostoc sp. NIES-2111]